MYARSPQRRAVTSVVEQLKPHLRHCSSHLRRAFVGPVSEDMGRDLVRAVEGVVMVERLLAGGDADGAPSTSATMSLWIKVRRATQRGVHSTTRATLLRLTPRPDAGGLARARAVQDGLAADYYRYSAMALDATRAHTSPACPFTASQLSMVRIAPGQKEEWGGGAAAVTCLHCRWRTPDPIPRAAPRVVVQRQVIDELKDDVDVYASQWDAALSPYGVRRTAGTHRLCVHAADALGFSQASWRAAGEWVVWRPPTPACSHVSVSAIAVETFHALLAEDVGRLFVYRLEQGRAAINRGRQSPPSRPSGPAVSWARRASGAAATAAAAVAASSAHDADAHSNTIGHQLRHQRRQDRRAGLDPALFDLAHRLDRVSVAWARWSPRYAGRPGREGPVAAGSALMAAMNEGVSPQWRGA